MKGALNLTRWASLLVSLSITSAHPFTIATRSLQARQDGGDMDEWDFSWVKSYAAIGDSFAAGIGVGERRPEQDAYDCSRYTGAYPLKVQNAIQAENFFFVACSGDTSKDIIQNQFFKLPPISNSNFDLFTVSAGGNDVGFSDVLKACVFLFPSDEACKKALEEAEKKIDENLERGISDVLRAVEPRLNPSGIIAWTLYGKFFDESPEPCNSQKWCFIDLGCTTVTVEVRQQMNRLVGKTNAVILSTLNKYNQGKTTKKVYPAHWGGYVMAADGQFCEADSHDNYDDPTNAKLAFIRPDLGERGDLRRSAAALDPYYNQTAMDEWKRDTAGIIPDSVLRNFHPNELGTFYQASSALSEISKGWMEYNGINEADDSQVCLLPSNPEPEPTPEPQEDLRCTDPKMSKSAYISRDGMVGHVDKFCSEEVDGKERPDVEKKYQEDTYNGALLKIKSPHTISKDECKKRFMSIVDGCVPAENNKMNWKYGGDNSYDGTEYKINIAGSRSTNRRTEDDGGPMLSVKGKCDSFYQLVRDEFWIYGSGFMDGDWGNELLNQMSNCIGSRVTDWTFEYYDKPDKDGMEWKAFGHTPIWQKNCFSPVIKGSGGPDIPCYGSG
ncbi:SGNH hydrolase [Polyplosphaeria fusca]|uniref:SGNH hydrolase n=1 Tax=Polyplosphaeria fusca TaxID=682080 RepID=A0A9P4QWC2_9PLEO|nr:SGNH hydrolase [Polyplosphaeria fusca]